MTKISERAMFAALAIVLSAGVAQAAAGYSGADAADPAAQSESAAPVTAEDRAEAHRKGPRKGHFEKSGRGHRKGERPSLEAVFERMDTNADGAISLEEFEAAAAKRAEMRGKRGQ